MKILLVVIALVAFCLLTLGTINRNSRSQQQAASQQQRLAELENSKDRGTLRWHAAVAKAKGQARVILPAPVTEYAGGDIDFGLDNALAAYGLVIGTPLVKLSKPYGQDEIVTWYKVRVIKTLSQQSQSAGLPVSIAGPPAELLPLKEEEFITAQEGGTLRMDGVSITMSNPRFSPLKMGNEYLFLIWTYPSGNTAICGGPAGIFRISNGVIEALDRNPHRFHQEMTARFSNSLEQLETYARSRPVTR